MSSLRSREIYNEYGYRLLAVESVDVRCSNFAYGCQLFGKIEPVAVIVCGPRGVYALDAEARPVDLDQLRQDIPGLDELLESESDRHH